MDFDWMKNNLGAFLIVLALVQIILSGHALRVIKDKESDEYKTSTGTMIVSFVVGAVGYWCMTRHESL